MQPTVTIDMRTVEQLDKNLATMALLSGRSMDSIISQASWRAAKSAAKATPQAKPNRKASMNKSTFGTVEKRRKKGVPWWAIGMVEIWVKGNPRTTFFRTNASFQRARKTPRRGLAKNVWRASATPFKRLGVTGNMGLSKKYSSTKISKSGGLINAVAMSNNLRYVSNIAPNSARIAIHNTDKWVEGYALPNLERKLLRQFGRGAAAIRGF